MFIIILCVFMYANNMYHYSHIYQVKILEDGHTQDKGTLN